MNTKENLEAQNDTDQNETADTTFDWLYELIDEIRL